LNEWLNRYELGFGLGLSPNGSGVRLLGWILANGLVELVRTQWAPLGHAEQRKGEGKEAAGGAGLGSQLSFCPQTFRD
jgi:hypothetical protein